MLTHDRHITMAHQSNPSNIREGEWAMASDEWAAKVNADMARVAVGVDSVANAYAERFQALGAAIRCIRVDPPKLPTQD